MNTSHAVPPTKALELPEPGYPMLTHMISNALFPDAQSMGCPHCGSSILVPADSSAWIVDQPHPLVPEMTVVRMFIEEDGVEIYSVPKINGKGCTRSFVPMSWIKLREEVMPLDVFVEALASTVKPGLPMITRAVSNSFFGRVTKVGCPSCKAPISVPTPSDKIKDDPVVWTVGQPHPHTLAGTEMKLLRIVIEDDMVWIYSVSNDSQSGMRHSFSVEWLRFSEEALTPDVLVQEVEKAESGGDEEEEPEDPEDPEAPESKPENPTTAEPPMNLEPAPASPTNGQQTQPS